MQNVLQLTQQIKERAKALGFLDCGIAKADFLEEEAPRLENWLNKNYHGKMNYMANHFDMRLDPRLLLEGAKSVIVLSYNYFPAQQQRDDSFKVAKYAYGQDYHVVVKQKAAELLAFIKDEVGEINGRAFTDSAPILEHAWAKRAGIGWVGKNSLTISKAKGSFFFLAEIILDIPLVYDVPMQTDHCGSCTRCIDACPTEAILPNKTVDGSKCISYFTIELKENIPDEMKGKWNDWIFGCDVCQDVCPWNRFSITHQEPDFMADDNWLQLDQQEWKHLSEENFKNYFKKSAVKRTKFEGLKRNIDFLK